MAKQTKSREPDSLPGKKPRRSDGETSAPTGIEPGAKPKRGTRAEALDLIFESAVRDKEGFRHGALGSPRTGKTYHLQDLVDEAHDRGIVDLALIHDRKRAEPQYRGTVRANPADVRARPPGAHDEPTIVFHPPIGGTCSVDEVSEYGFFVAQRGQRVLVLPDELYAGLKGRQTWEKGIESATAKAFREGSSQGLSIAWTTQVPQSLPTEACDLSETVALFHMEGRSAVYAADVFRLPPEAVAMLGRLERGEFLLFNMNAAFDGTIYGPE